MTAVAFEYGARAATDFLDAHRLSARTPFQTRGWWRAWIREAADAEGATPVLVHLTRTDRPTVVVGLQLHQDGGTAVLRPLSWPWADYHEVAEVGDASPTGPGPDIEGLAEAIGRCQREFGARLELSNLVAEGPLVRAVSELGAAPQPSETVFRLDLTDPEVVQRVSERRDMRRKRRRIERLGTLRLTCADTSEGIAARLPAFIALHNQQWGDRPDAVAPFDGGVIDRTYAAVAAEPSSAARLHELWLDDTLLAGWFGFRHDRTYYAYRAAYNMSHGRDSPGHLLIAAMATELVGQGTDTFDLTRGDYAYKLELPSSSALTMAASLEQPCRV
ncbi:GNAT family N-acetyltransferase [Actinacidiphila acididurans]|uniref:GNAT family N-acetyltransferase n=1 Tax=Actinacidiphila acididurans TaxID=2784346 RepID=A0ABS2TLB0_9ACTN|nr:GNAT family N-acetyltransferase [Actinacidiphila acididurans]MBM9503806.1 GNAT family N-acetyltransferase [Actinacidiphila acididurans]